jgi:hypothetical protein
VCVCPHAEQNDVPLIALASEASELIICLKNMAADGRKAGIAGARFVNLCR